jgi:hypothetical protein
LRNALQTGKVRSVRAASRTTNGFKGVAEPVTNWRARHDLSLAAHAFFSLAVRLTDQPTIRNRSEKDRF